MGRVRFNKLIVPEAFFVSTVLESGEIGGRFGLMEIAFRMSNQTVGERTYTETWRKQTDYFYDGNHVGSTVRFAQEVWSVPIYNSGWSALLATSPQSGRQTRQDKSNDAFDTEKIRENFVELYSNEKCKNFLDKLFGSVATKKNYVEEGGDMVKLFDVLMSPSQRGLTRKSPNGAKYGTVDGRIKDKDLMVFVNKNKTFVTENDTMTIFHELIHAAGHKEYYTDRRLAQAIFDNFPETRALLNDDQIKSMINPTDHMKNDSGAYQWGGVFSTALDYYCFKDENGDHLLFENPFKKKN